jgi:hypothetical protein
MGDRSQNKIKETEPVSINKAADSLTKFWFHNIRPFYINGKQFIQFLHDCDYSTRVSAKQSAFFFFKKDYLKFKKTLIHQKIVCAYIQ